MAGYLSMPDVLTGTLDEKAARINDFLREIQDLLAQDENISKRVRYHIKARGENERNRLAKIHDFQETDYDTMRILAQNSNHWKANPESFWMRPMPCTPGLIEPQAQSRMVRRHLCILLLELQSHNRDLSAEGIANILHSLDAENYRYDRVEAVVKEMVDAGSKYKNLENALGKGVLFVLGQEISESYWTKLLPKSGKAFNEAIEHLRNVKLPDVAKEYRELRESVIESKLVLMMNAEVPQMYQHQPQHGGFIDFSGAEWNTLIPETPYTFAAGQMPYNEHFG